MAGLFGGAIFVIASVKRFIASGTVSTASGLGRFGSFGLEFFMPNPDDLVATPPRVMMAVWPTMGMIITHWALAEHALCASAALIHKHLGGNTIEEEIPRSLSRVTKFLRRCFKKLPHLAPFKDEGEQILRELEKHAQVRHTLIHGAVKGFSERQAALYFERVNLDIPSDVDVRATKLITLEQISETVRVVSNLSVQTLNFCAGLFRAFVKK